MTSVWEATLKRIYRTSRWVGGFGLSGGHCCYRSCTYYKEIPVPSLRMTSPARSSGGGVTWSWTLTTDIQRLCPIPSQSLLFPLGFMSLENDFYLPSNNPDQTPSRCLKLLFFPHSIMFNQVLMHLLPTNHPFWPALTLVPSFLLTCVTYPHIIATTPISLSALMPFPSSASTIGFQKWRS
jgi:hypothetical protein